ncbi:MAG: ComF family protein [Clostridia bacterium]
MATKPHETFFKRLKSSFSKLFFPQHITCLCCKKEIDEKEKLTFCQKCEKSLPYNNQKICTKCGTYLEKGTSTLCINCKNSQKFYKKARAPFIYEGSIKKLVYDFKYNDCTYLAEPLSNMMSREIVLSNFTFDVIIPVPLCKTRLRERGYNQSLLLSNAIAKNFNSHVVTNALIRIKKTQTQTHLSFDERRKNLENAFTIANSDGFKGKNVLLVDDVFTTGATAENCSELLFNNGAKNIYVITLAHTSIKNETQD